MRGRHVFMGYLYNPEATMKTIDANGWLHSGDLGRLDEEGFLSITGRIKELIITAGGENVPPVLIESAIKAAIPAASNVIVIGDKRKFLSALITLKSDVDAKGNPTNDLVGETLAMVKACNSDATTVAEAVLCPHVQQVIQAGIDKVNAEATSRAQRIRKWVAIKGDFTLNGGEVSKPTLANPP
jgi:long-chain-fatty-acid--CoA ligase ACSBG